MRLSFGPALRMAGMASTGRRARSSPLVILAVLLPFCRALGVPLSEDLFRQGVEAYRAADYAQAAESFRQAAAWRPASGTLQNLGNAEWQHGQVGPAVLAWERALWLDAFNERARGNLRLARKVAQLDTPDLAWYEVISTWLPVNWWAWITGASLWLAVGMGLLPGVLGLRKSAWQQAAAALGLALFLLSVPAQLGVMMRARVAFVLQKDTPLRRTPTLEAEEPSRLGAGESLRLERTRGNYYLVRTRLGLQGWVARSEVGLICPRP